MSMLQTFLNNHQPPEWDRNVNYSNQRFVMKSIPQSQEYNTVRGLLNYASVRDIKRVQNPYTLGAFLVRKLELGYRSISFTEKYYFMTVPENEINGAIEWNLDDRRTPSLSAPSETPISRPGCATIVVKILRHSGHDLMYWSQDRVAQYVILFPK